MSILQPGFVKWDGTKYVLEDSLGPAGAPGVAGIAGPAGTQGTAGPAGWDLVSEVFTPILILDAPRVQTVGNTGARVIIARAPSGHVEGTPKRVIIPAGFSTDLVIASDWNCSNVGAYNPANTTIIDFLEVGGKAESILTSLPALDVTAATIVSAFVYSTAPDQLAVNYSKGVIVTGLTGKSLSNWTGTPKTISSVIQSSNGNSQILYQLSGAIQPTDAFRFNDDGTATKSLNGPNMTGGAVSVTNNTGIFADTVFWWRLDQATVISTKVTQIADLSGNSNICSQGTGSNQPAYVVSNAAINNQPSMTLDGVNDSLLCASVLVGGSPPSAYTGYTFVAVVKIAIGAVDHMLLDTTNGAGTEFTSPNLQRSTSTGGFDVEFWTDGTVGHTPFLLSNDGTWNVWVGIHTGTDNKLYKNGTLVSTKTFVTVPGAIVQASIGRGIQTGFGPMNGEGAEYMVIGHALNAPELAALGVNMARYGLGW